MVRRINRTLLDEIKGDAAPKHKIFAWDNHDGKIDAAVERLQKLHGGDVEIVVVGWLPPDAKERDLT